MSSPIVVSERPHLVINNFCPNTPVVDSMKSIDILDGSIAINLQRAEIGKKAAAYAVFASAGMNNKEIGEVTRRSPATIQTQLQSIYHGVEINGRANIAEWLFAKGIFSVDQEATPPHLSRREKEVINHVSEGLSNHDIGRRLHISEHTVKHHLTRISGRVGFSKRAAIALTAFVIAKPKFEFPAA